MISKKMIIALATATVALAQPGCVSFESEVFTAASAAPTLEQKPDHVTQASTMPIDNPSTVDLASVSPR